MQSQIACIVKELTHSAVFFIPILTAQQLMSVWEMFGTTITDGAPQDGFKGGS